MNLFKIAENLQQALVDAGVRFNLDGYPIIPDEMILQDYPDEMVPFEHRNTCKDPQKTVLTHFSNDELLYRRLRRIDEDIEICKSYMGVAGFDLSPRLGWNVEQQKFNLLINQMVNTYRLYTGQKTSEFPYRRYHHYIGTRFIPVKWLICRRSIRLLQGVCFHQLGLFNHQAFV